MDEFKSKLIFFSFFYYIKTRMKSNDAKNLTDYNIIAYTKGFVASGVLNGVMTNNYFQYKEIYNIVHHVGIGVEIICYNGIRKIFYNSGIGDSKILFDLITVKINVWIGSNLN